MITVTRATQADLDGVENIENACFGDDRFSRRQLLYLMIYAKGVCFIVRENGQAKAYISLLYKNNADNLRIYSLAVLPESRGKGFAQLLLEKSKEFAKKNALRQITLEVKTTNTDA
ncbi:MAG TPA: GNAT family N-acetyltransferase, partial [Paludibacteraceae bacterium]|nr:GNAT family N-acetyltransferase [Paludibacteraceae bacterium]